MTSTGTATAVPMPTYTPTPIAIKTPSQSPTPMPSRVPPLFGVGISGHELIAMCDTIYYYGARAIELTITWQMIEPINDQWDWRLDSYIERAEFCGFTLLAHIDSKSSWGTMPRSDHGGPSRPPTNMDDYQDFVKHVAEHYQGRIKAYSFEVEAASNFYWAGTVEQYGILLDAGYEAVKAADPDALVLNDGLSSSGMTALYAKHMYDQGRAVEALDFLKTNWEHFPANVPRLETVEDLEALFELPEAERVFAWLPMLLERPQSYDEFQMHYFGPSEHLAIIMDWARERTNKPIQLWEFGYGWSDRATFDERKQAEAIQPLLTIAAEHGATVIIWWRFTDEAEKAGEGVTGLWVTGQGPRPSADIFRTVSEKYAINSPRHDGTLR